MKAERVRALGALHSLLTKKMIAAEKRRETHLLRNEETKKLIKEYAEREIAVARERVEDAEAPITMEEEDMGTAENMGLTTGEPEKTFEEVMVAIGDSLSDLESSDDGEDEDDEDDKETEQGKLSDDDEPGWVMGTISTVVQQHMERFRQKQMKLDALTQPGWGDAADYFCPSDKKYARSEFTVPALVIPQTDDDAVAPAPRTFGEPMDCLDLVPRVLHNAGSDFLTRK